MDIIEDPEPRGSGWIIAAVVLILVGILLALYLVKHDNDKKDSARTQSSQSQTNKPTQAEKERAEAAAAKAAKKRADAKAAAAEQEAATAKAAAKKEVDDAQDKADKAVDKAKDQTTDANAKADAAAKNAKKEAAVAADETAAKDAIRQAYLTVRDESTDSSWGTSEDVVALLSDAEVAPDTIDKSSDTETVFVDVSGPTLTLSYLTVTDSLCTKTADRGVAAEDTVCEQL